MIRDEFERPLTAGLADDEPDAGLLAQHLACPIPGVHAIEHDTDMRMRSGSNFQQRLDAYITELDAKATVIRQTAGQPEMDDKHGGTTDHRPATVSGGISQWPGGVAGKRRRVASYPGVTVATARGP